MLVYRIRHYRNRVVAAYLAGLLTGFAGAWLLAIMLLATTQHAAGI